MMRWHSIARTIGALVIVATIVVGCGSNAPAATAVRASLAPVAPLNISFGSVSTLYGVPFVALGDNLFEKNGVQVNVVTYSALTVGTSQLVAGQIDLFVSGAGLASQIAQQGKPVSIIYTVTDYTGWQAGFFTKPGITSMAQLASLGTNCKIAIEPRSTGFRAWGKAVARLYHLGCSFLEVASPPAALGAVVAGSADGAVVQANTAIAASHAGKGNVIIDPSKLSAAEAQKIVPVRYPGLAVMGLTSTLQSKKEAIRRFVHGLVEAQALSKTSSSQQLAEWSLRVPGAPFGAALVSDVKADYDGARPNFPTGSRAGFITPSAWATALTGYSKDWESPNLDPTGARVQYGAMIDMSFLNAVLGGNSNP